MKVWATGSLLCTVMLVSAIAEAVPGPKVGIASDGTNDPCRTRLIDELAARGFDVRQTDRRHQEQVGHDDGLAAWILVSFGRLWVIVAERDGETVERREAWIDLGKNGEDSAAAIMRAVEFLRASLMEVRVGLRREVSQPTPTPKLEQHTPVASQSASDANTNAVTVGLGTGVIRSTGGFGSVAVLVPSVSTRLAPTLGMRVQLSVPVSSASVAEPEGDAALRPTALSLQGWWMPAHSRWVSPYVGVGLGATYLSIEAHPAGGYRAYDDSRVGAMPLGVAGVSVLPGRVRLRVEGMVGTGFERAEVRFAQREVGSWGRWVSAAVVSLEVVAR